MAPESASRHEPHVVPEPALDPVTAGAPAAGTPRADPSSPADPPSPPATSSPPSGPRRPGGAALIGPVVRLDPSVTGDAEALFRALDDPRVYAKAYNGGRRPASPDEVAGWIEAAAADNRAMFTARLIADTELGPADTVVGTSSLGDVVPVHGRVHLGWTAYSPRVWGTAVNPACKLLLLAHAFEACGFERVKIQTDAINDRSQAAIAALGATREGVLRHHQRRADGSWRDTVVFSILSAEWPAVRARLLQRIGA